MYCQYQQKFSSAWNLVSVLDGRKQNECVVLKRIFQPKGVERRSGCGKLLKNKFNDLNSLSSVRCLFIFGATAPSGPGPPHSRDFYITHHDTPQSVDCSGRVIRPTQRPLADKTQHSQQSSMPPAGFEPTISAGERPQNYAIDRAATGIVVKGHCLFLVRQPPVGQGLLIHEVSRSPTKTHHSR